MVKWKTDRATIFLGILFLLFLWDFVYFLGLRDPNRLPHPFVVFRKLGDVELLHGFPSMLRYFLFIFVLGGLLGIGVGRFIRRNAQLTETSVQVLRLGRCLPFLIVFAVPDPWALGIAAAMFGSCYYYLVATSVLRLEGPEIRSLVARELAPQILWFSLISQIWLSDWKWFIFAPTYQALDGLAVLFLLVVILLVIQWIFRSDFEAVAEAHGRIINEDLKNADWKWLCVFLLFTLAFTIIWERIGYVRFSRWSGSPLGALSVAYDLLTHSEFYADIKISFLELFGGIVLGGSIGLFVVALMSASRFIRSAFIWLLPLSNISLMVLWLLSFVILGNIVPNFLFWHKVIGVGCLVFFPFIQALWGIRGSGIPSRLLMATDYTLPIAFIAMLFAELWASTAGLGFMMTIAGATSQADKGFAGFLITAVLLAGISAVLRSIVKMLCASVEARPAQTVSGP